MTDPLLILDTITIKQASLDEKVRLAASAGFRGLELWDSDLGEDQTCQTVCRLADHHRLTIEGVCPGPEVYRWHHLWDEPLEALWAQRLASYAASGARYVVVPVMSEDGTLVQTAHHFHRLSAMAARYGIRAGLEPIGHVRKLSNVADAIAIIAQDSSNAGIILDVFHFFRGGNRLEILQHVDPGIILAVHLDDAMDLPLSELVGYRHRVYPGHGIFDVRGFCQSLMRIGYRGPYVVELLNEQYWRSDPGSVCTTAYDASCRVLAEAGRPTGLQRG